MASKVKPSTSLFGELIEGGETEKTAAYSRFSNINSHKVGKKNSVKIYLA